MKLRIGRRQVGPVLAASLALVLVAAGAAASLETGTVGSFWEGLWWAVSLMTTVGFIGAPPETVAGAIVSVALMVSGFFLLALVSAALASLFVQEEQAPQQVREETTDKMLLERLSLLNERVASLESRLTARGTVEPDGERSTD